MKIKNNLIRKIRKIFGCERNDVYIDQILFNQGKILSALNRGEVFNRLCDYEWKVASQWGEDGIIDFLVSEIPIQNKTFIEFGVEDFSESNCRFLMINRNWQGFVIDGSVENLERMQRSRYFWKYDLQYSAKFITNENINETICKSGFSKDLGILSIDLDGNDYHILSNIDSYSPRILICEFNPLFGKEREITVPYDSNFDRTQKHYSNLYFGASIAALTFLAREKGYTLVGTGLHGGNAYFIRNDLMTPLLRSLSENPNCFEFNWREGRDVDGRLNFLRAEERYQAIKGMDVLNVRTGLVEPL